MDGFFATGEYAPPLRHNTTLLKLASLAVIDGSDRETADIYPFSTKQAIVPPAGMGGDPSGGMAPPQDPAAGGMPPPPDPSGGSAPPAPPAGGGIDPSMIQAIVQQVIQQIGAGGAGGMAGGKGMGAKKVDPAIIDAKLYDIDKKISLICDQMGIQIPATQTLGLPPEPMAAQMAAQDSQDVSQAMSGGAPAGPQGIQPMGGMDATQGPIGKAAASFGDSYPAPTSLLASAAIRDPGNTLSAARIRQRMGA